MIIYVREDILNRMLAKHNFPDNIEDLFVELNFRKTKWILRRMYDPPSQPNQYFINTLDKALNIYSNYENILFLGGFNAEIGETHFDTFLYQYQLANVSKKPICYKNSEIPSWIDLFCHPNQRAF